jgi:DNA-binding NtrC family response regulator
MAALMLLTGPQAGRRHEVQGEVLIGRSPSCTIVLDDAKVSRRHVRLLIEDAQARVTDLGSRNGTLVNGERLDSEAILLPGDRLQVGDSTVLFEPSVRASLTDVDTAADLRSAALEDLIDVVGPMAGLYNAGMALISATSEAMVLRRAAEELARGVNAEKAAAMLGGSDGLLTASIAGGESVTVPRSLVRGALERKEAGRSRGMLCAPLTASGGPPFGLLYAERPESFGDPDLRVIAALGRLAGEALTSVRGRTDGGVPVAPLVGSSRQFRKAVDLARRAAMTPDPVVISGEPGTGRTQIALYIHSRSRRALGPLVKVDCRSGAQEVEESLFGRSSAPGVPPRSSALLKADGGSILLACIEALPRHLGGRLARVLSRKVAPARQGGEEAIDVRILSTASAPLEELIRRGELDSELGRVLEGTAVEALAVRDRRSDVIALVEFFALEAARRSRTELVTVSPDARRLLTDYHWPGNVAEVRGVAERLALLYAGVEVTPLRLPPEIQSGPLEARRTLAQQVARLERNAIAEALREARGKKIRAAAILGISRPTLDKKISEFKLIVDKRRA